MIYLFNLLWGYLAFSVYEKKYSHSSYISSLFFLLPVISIWITLIGGQLGVGTDYRSYLTIFNNADSLDYYTQKGEYFFVAMVSFFQWIGFGGQFFFVLFSILFSVLYLIISRKVTRANHALFFFLFITLSTLFHNQMNGLRQCTAVYFVTIGVLELYSNKKWHFLLCVFIAAGFHVSSLGCLGLFFLRNITFNIRQARFLLVISMFMSFISIDAIISEIVPFIPQYSHYADSTYFEEGVSLTNKLTKLYLFPIYIMSISFLSKQRSQHIEKCFQLGIIAYIIRTLCLVSPITNRFGYFFLLLSILPIFYYLCDLKRTNRLAFLSICSYILCSYCIKVLIFPSAEYSYKSIFSAFF